MNFVTIKQKKLSRGYDAYDGNFGIHFGIAE
jgi:hypothetical protein